MNKVWVDKVFGMRHVEGLMMWLKVSNRLNNEDHGILEDLTMNFQLPVGVIQALVNWPGNLLHGLIDNALSTD